MTPIVVMPALNEGTILAAACASLSFGCGRTGAGVHLVLVNNGSTDATRAVMEEVADRSEQGTVTVVDEPVRGYVPARVAGIEAARRLAARNGVDPGKTFLLQVDADTRYMDGYVARMTAAALKAGPGRLIEGASIAPLPEQDRCQLFRAFEDHVDRQLAGILEFDGDNDVVIDDKLAGYRLSDYDAWGGHRSEFTAAGHAVLAETTRLFIRAKALGATRVRVDEALAVTSQRRILSDPALAFATGGFPRDGGWVAGWQTAYSGARDLDAFRIDASQTSVAEAVRMRRRHLIAMFALLPAYFGAADCPGALLLQRLGLGHPVDVSEPGRLLEQLLALSDEDVGVLLRARDDKPRQ